MRSALAWLIGRSCAQDVFLMPRVLPELRSENAVAHDSWVFSIHNQDHPTLCLDVTGGSGDSGTPLEIWECNGQEGQLFFFDAGAFLIQWAGDASKCVDSGDLNDGTQLFLWDCNDQDQQHWGYDSDSGTIYLVASSTDASKCMDIAGGDSDSGTPIIVWDCDHSLWSQQWVIWPGITIRTRENYELCLDSSGTENGAAVQLWQCNGLPNQLWDFQGDSFQIRFAQDTSKCIDSGDMASDLFLWECNGSDQQKFGYDADWGTLYLAASSDASKCVDISGGSLNWGSPIGVWDCNGCWNQGFDVIGPAASLTRASSRLSSSVQDDCPPKPAPGPSPGPPSPPTPSPAGIYLPACQNSDHDWPRFDDESSLNASPWGRYFESVYGSVPSFGYPICTFDFWFLYKDKFQAAGITDKASVGNCPSQEGDHFSAGIGFQAGQASWIWHPGPFNALESTTWVEVTHSASGGESGGAWFMMAPGSGLWVNLGTTKSYTEHSDIFSEFTDCDNKGGDNYNQLCPCGQKHGISSLQFLAHDDPEWKCPGVGPAGNWKRGSSPLDIEIVMCDLDGEKSCGGQSDAFRAGWMASQACDCQEKGGPANCQNMQIAPR